VGHGGFYTFCSVVETMSGDLMLAVIYTNQNQLSERS